MRSTQLALVAVVGLTASGCVMSMRDAMASAGYAAVPVHAGPLPPSSVIRVSNSGKVERVCQSPGGLSAVAAAVVHPLLIRQEVSRHPGLTQTTTVPLYLERVEVTAQRLLSSTAPAALLAACSQAITALFAHDRDGLLITEVVEAEVSLTVGFANPLPSPRRRAIFTAISHALGATAVDVASSTASGIKMPIGVRLSRLDHRRGWPQTPVPIEDEDELRARGMDQWPPAPGSKP